MVEENKNLSIDIKDVKDVLELFSKLDTHKKEIALAALTGMVLVSDCENKGA